MYEARIFIRALNFFADWGIMFDVATIPMDKKQPLRKPGIQLGRKTEMK